jgi:hypothetical protein
MSEAKLAAVCGLHCGPCDGFPCGTFTDFYDPLPGPEEAAESVRSRRGAVLRRKEVGTKKWLESLR